MDVKDEAPWCIVAWSMLYELAYWHRNAPKETLNHTGSCCVTAMGGDSDFPSARITTSCNENRPR